MAKARKLPSCNWRVRVFDGVDQAGKKRYKSFTAPTKKQAEYLAAEYAANKKRAASVQDDRTLAEAYARYIEIKQNTLSPTTVVEYTRSASRDFPELMPLKLSRITQEAVQSAVNIMSASHSPKSVRNAHGLLSAVLNMFAPDIRLNTRLPQSTKPDIYVPIEPEIEKLIRNIKGTELLKAVLLAAFGSLRRSEVCALTESDLDRQGGIVHVNKAMVWAITKEWVLKQPKSKAGYRDVTMPPFVMERLVPMDGQHRIVNLVPTTVTNRFAKALKSVNLPHFRFHDLRHYQASILHAMGVPDKYIMERGGWKTDSTLKNIYQHTMSDKRKEIEADIVRKFEEQHRKYDTEDDTAYQK
jgi:integrase